MRKVVKKKTLPRNYLERNFNESAVGRASLLTPEIDGSNPGINIKNLLINSTPCRGKRSIFKKIEIIKECQGSEKWTWKCDDE